ANGPLAGRTVGEALRIWGHDLVGIAFDPEQGMPLLVKFIDASDWLSVQVHPDDEQAGRLEGDPRGKTEAWYVLAADPGAQLICGVTPGISTDDLRAAIATGRLREHLIYADVQPGDVLLNHAGAIHAIGPGLLIYEIQQASDVTYRLYDWDRVDLDGTPRPLHLDKGLAVAVTDRAPDLRHTGGDTSPVVDLVSCPYFHTRLHTLRAGDIDTVITTRGRFQILTVIAGAVELTADGEPLLLALGRTALIPAGLPAFTLRASAGEARLLRSWPA
ncbi:MAG: class I mannose-6-phosphate isomerase, partial [Anaerolinea sp.]|nr:class I mannose-6-phosphate isomerase [Anaerolinea sp.]